MVRFGLDQFLLQFPARLKGKRLGVLCHAASITSGYEHIVDALKKRSDCTVGAVFGPQHGLFGQTQDNMIEWEGETHPDLKVPVFSLYGRTRKPTPEMLARIDALVVDLQDVGARPYTYIWTLKLCMEACDEINVPIWVLDRPNPIAAVALDGPMLDRHFFTFVGGAEIPLCHRMTIAEIACFLKDTYYPTADLHTVTMDGWWRNSMFGETGLPWVLPSPNMPCPETATVYPGMVFLEATNLSEGRGTTRPFELFGAPFIDVPALRDSLGRKPHPGCLFREHGFIPTFNKWQGRYCYGMQIHVTDPRSYKPAATAVSILSACIETAKEEFRFKGPPYEYEAEKVPFDILAGDSRLREALIASTPVDIIEETWRPELDRFRTGVLAGVALYPESRK